VIRPGAGYLVNVHRWWSQYFGEYMFHHLMEQGYTILDVDYRGSAGYGRHWRSHLSPHGKRTSPTSLTLRNISSSSTALRNALAFTEEVTEVLSRRWPYSLRQELGAGAPLRPVTDCLLQSSLHIQHLNQPQEDDEAFRRSSPIYLPKDGKIRC
jgi:hypothetical protein